MFFSTVHCIPGQVEVLSTWNPYEVHRFVWHFFEPDPNADRDFLYRYDLERGRPHFFLLSRRPPKRGNGFWRAETKEFQPLLQEGDRLMFSLRVNPTICIRGKRHDVVMHQKKELAAEGPREVNTASLWHEAGLAWLLPRAESQGFRVNEGQVRVDSYQRHTFHKKHREVVITTLDFQGLLEVTDVRRFTHLLFNGMGPAKGFGCGLMLVRRV